MPAGLGAPFAVTVAFSGSEELMDVVDMTLASLPERARKLRWTDAVAARMGVDVFMVVSGDVAPAREERRRRRRGRDSSVEGIDMDGRTWDPSGSFSWVRAGAVGVTSS